MGQLIVAEFHRREYEQAVIDAKAAAMEAEEHRFARDAWSAPDLRSVPPRSEALLPPD
jgi:hypothetical protein